MEARPPRPALQAPDRSGFHRAGTHSMAAHPPPASRTDAPGPGDRRCARLAAELGRGGAWRPPWRAALGSGRDLAALYGPRRAPLLRLARESAHGSSEGVAHHLTRKREPP